MKKQAAAKQAAVCIMVLGTTSNAGKSWLATALCRYYANLGLKVAPFKAQNMSNNARVVGGSADGSGSGGGSGTGGVAGLAGVAGEIGSAQYFQALAARAIPDVRMNPLLLKPESDTHSQVVLLGQVSPELTRVPWRERSGYVWPAIAAALDALRAENDIVVIEGAGSPAEINLMDSDIVNLRVARHAQARCLLITDIDRGGAFAHLYGTWALMPEADRALIHGFVLNKFRGDASLLSPAPEQLEVLTGVPTVATLPMWREHGLPEEDGVFEPPPRTSTARVDAMNAAQATTTTSTTTTITTTTTIAIIGYPRISNLDEFAPLANLSNVRLVWARAPADMLSLDARTDWIILPGSKNTVADLAWLRAQGLAQGICTHAAANGRVLGICGGLQMLGETLIGTEGLESGQDLSHAKNDAKNDAKGGSVTQGLGLLPLSTQFLAKKTLQRGVQQFLALQGAWAGLSGLSVEGYEIHQGHTLGAKAVASVSKNGNVLGIYLHGLFENDSVLHALFHQKTVKYLDEVFDGLADFVNQHMRPGLLAQLARR
jgi:adenosylcobyric acid synthase